MCVLLWKISFVQVPSLTLSWTNAITHRRTRLFECFTIQIRFLQLSTLTLTCTRTILNIPQLNTSFWVFCDGKSDFSKCELWLEIAQMRYPTAKHVFLCVLPSANFDLKLHELDNPSQNTSFQVLYSGKPDFCNSQLWL